MNLQQLNTWLSNPEKIDSSVLPALEDLVSKFPYCRLFELLFLLGLKSENDYRFSQQLRVAAAYSADRAKLRRLVEDQGVDRKKITQKSTPSVADMAIPGLSDSPEAAQEVSDGGKEKILEIEKMIRDSLSEIEEKRNRLRLLLEEKKLLLARRNGLTEIPEEEALSRPLPKDELLEDFIRQQDHARKGTFFDPVEKARKSLEDEGQVISETLARLLASQGKKARAIKIYQQLLLNNPEKSSYFAAQIENLKNNLND